MSSTCKCLSAEPKAFVRKSMRVMLCHYEPLRLPVILTLHKVKGKNLNTLRAGSVKGENPMALRAGEGEESLRCVCERGFFGSLALDSSSLRSRFFVPRQVGVLRMTMCSCGSVVTLEL